jgi:hypothetical protein
VGRKLTHYLAVVFCAIILVSALLPAQSAPANIVPGDNLVTDGISPIPVAIAATTNRYTEFRPATFQDWHPSERSMLITTRFGETNQVHEVKFPGGARTQLTFFPDRVASASYQPTKGDYFLFLKDVSGGEWFQIYRYDFATGDSTLLTDGKSRNLGVRWNHAGDRIAYSSTRRNGKDTDIWVVDPRDPKSNHLLVQVEGGGWEVTGWSSDDKQFALLEYISIGESYVWMVNAASSEKRLLTPKGGAEKISYAGGNSAKTARAFTSRPIRIQSSIASLISTSQPGSTLISHHTSTGM